MQLCTIFFSFAICEKKIRKQMYILSIIIIILTSFIYASMCKSYSISSNSSNVQCLNAYINDIFMGQNLLTSLRHTFINYTCSNS